jgi:hypothetical protein
VKEKTPFFCTLKARRGLCLVLSKHKRTLDSVVFKGVQTSKLDLSAVRRCGWDKNFVVPVRVPVDAVYAVILANMASSSAKVVNPCPPPPPPQPPLEIELLMGIRQSL